MKVLREKLWRRELTFRTKRAEGRARGLQPWSLFGIGRLSEMTRRAAPTWTAPRTPRGRGAGREEPCPRWPASPGRRRRATVWWHVVGSVQRNRRWETSRHVGDGAILGRSMTTPVLRRIVCPTERSPRVAGRAEPAAGERRSGASRDPPLPYQKSRRRRAKRAAQRQRPAAAREAALPPSCTAPGPTQGRQEDKGQC